MEQGSQEWLDARRNRIMASDVPVIMGVHKYTTLYQLWQDKLGLLHRKSNACMDFGKMMEPRILAHFNQDRCLDLKPTVVFHDQHKWIGASFDGLSDDGTIGIEIKCANADDHACAKEGRVPEHYYPQVQWQLLCKDLKKHYYLSYHNDDIVVLEVGGNEEYQKSMFDKASLFWNDHVLALEPPELEARDFQWRDGEWSEVAARLAEIKTTKSELEKEEKALAAKLRELSHGHSSTDGTYRYARSYFPEKEIRYTKKSYESWRLSKEKR